MERGRVSVILPSRNEQFLPQTVGSLLGNARGDVEIVAVLEGYWPDPPLPDDPRLIVLHRGRAQGMRPAINAGMECATGEWLMKLDAHCGVSEGWDLVLKAECDADEVVVPRRLRLDPFTWTLTDQHKVPIDAHYLSYPFERPGDASCGLHGTKWDARSKARAHVLVDEEMSSQGSCWFTSRRHWEGRLRPMDVVRYGNFIQEFQEIGLRTWLSGGRCLVNKKCWYAHWHKGKHGRGYFISKSEQAFGADAATRYWMTDAWPTSEGRVRTLQWLVERFSPVPGWPADLDAAFRDARARLRAPEPAGAAPSLTSVAPGA